MNIFIDPSLEHFIRRARQDRHGELLMYIGEGCCDGTTPYLYEDFLVEQTAVQIGQVYGVPVYASQRLTRLHAGENWKLSVVEAVRDSFSIESDYGLQLVLTFN